VIYHTLYPRTEHSSREGERDMISH